MTPSVVANLHFAVGGFLARLLGPKLDRRKVQVERPARQHLLSCWDSAYSASEPALGGGKR